MSDEPVSAFYGPPSALSLADVRQSLADPDELTRQALAGIDGAFPQADTGQQCQPASSIAAEAEVVRSEGTVQEVLGWPEDIRRSEGTVQEVLGWPEDIRRRSGGTV